MSSQDIDQKIQDVYKKMQAERGVIQASERMRQATGNQDVIRTLDRKIREAEESISYFQETLQQLQGKKVQMERRDSGGLVSPTSAGPGGGMDGRSPGAAGRYGPGGRDGQGGGQRPDLHGSPTGAQNTPGFPAAANDSTSRPKPYTNLDLLKADTPYNTAKISRMYHQLEFKVTVEQQYKKATDSMLKLYQTDGDKKILQDTKLKQWESNKKIQLLQVALKKYRNLHVLEEDAEESPVNDEAGRPENMRKPVTGTLEISILEARDLEHAPVSVFKRSSKAGTDTSVLFKIEGNTRATSHPSRTDRWNERFEISVDKANEVEIGLYDKQLGEQPVPIGFLWIKISDLVEALRKQRVNETAGAGWATAGAMPTGQTSAVSPNGDMSSPLMPQGGMQPGGGTAGAGGASDGIKAWFAVEPVGAVLLQLDFVKENARRRPVDAGLGRQGAVKKRKEEVHEMNGHKFIAHQFYQIMKCAYCAEFLLKGSGYQCEDCRYLCHKECFPKVVTKCISKSNAETEKDEDKINHRIPHRFETITNMKATWCCHCGSILKFGRKNAKQCTECDITCHADCTHLVPDFCGMSMVAANELLGKIHAIKQQQKNARPQQPKIAAPTKRPTDFGSPPPAPNVPPVLEQINTGMSGMDIKSDPYASVPSRPPDESSRPPPYGPGGRFEEPDRGSNRYSSSPEQQRLPMTQQQREAMMRDQREQEMRDQRVRDQQQPLPGGFNANRRPPPPLYPDPIVSPVLSQNDRRDSYGSGPRPMPPPGSVPPPPPPKAYPNAVPDRMSYAQSSERPGSIVGPSDAMPFTTSPTQSPTQPSQQQVQRKPRRKVGLDDFNFLAVLGKGNFGKVMLAEEKKSNGLYAIKVLKKEFIIDNDEVESTRSEKRVFLAAARERHPFLLGLHSCFQTETRVYFVMEYVSGGDLMLHIQRKQFSLRQAKFYSCEVLLALEYFHANGIIYRDLKLDNILLTLDGHVKVADYGLCKEEMWYGNTTGTFCGTPEFMAPEILLEQKYGRAVDWWAFGVLVYEMLLGQSPFRGDDEDEIFDAILEDEPLYPITMPRDAVSVLQKLLTRDPTRRLGAGKADAEDIKRHPFFKDVSWDDVLNKRIPPPYYPTITSAADTSNFDSEFTREQPTLTPVHGQLSAQDQAEFQGFSWVAEWANK
ncbi:Serine/threonine kinase [Tulasnella sp. 330]|nr:Serine/threonine kinase [Tulasnella sp. 330]KAG8886613.1 Serine/threonine kinase [Tulasnella sp. 331]